MDFLTFFWLQAPAPTVVGAQSTLIDGEVWGNISRLVGKIAGALPYLMLAALVFAVSLLGARLAARAVKAIVRRLRSDEYLANLLGGLTFFVLMLLGTVFSVLVLFPGRKPLEVLTALGAFSVAVGLVFRDIADNFLSGIMILWRKPYVIGDEIRVGQYEGTVVGFTYRSTLIKTYANELAIIPNSHIYISEIIVKTAYEAQVVQLQVGIGYLDDIEKGRETIRRAVLEAEGVIREMEPLVAVSEFGASSVNFTVYFLAGSENLNIVKVSDCVATNIKYALDRAGVDMPYPHTVVIFQDAQAKNGSERNALARRQDSLSYTDATLLPAVSHDEHPAER